MNDYKCADCGCAINEGEFKTFGVCDDCYERNVSKRISDEAKDKFKREWADFTLIKENQSLRSELQKQKELNAELVSAIRVYVFQMDKFFGEPKVGQPPGLEMFREIIERESLIKKSKEP
jgi:hypothetical protein